MIKSLCTVFAALIFGFVSPAMAGMAAPETSSTPQADAPPAKIVFSPHRAIYTMALSSVKNGSNVVDVSGRMMFEWTDVCDGWAIQQHLKLHFSYGENIESDVTSTQLSWEAKDASAYTFNMKRTTDGKDTESYRGRAAMKPTAGHATYTLPAPKNIDLPATTLFPSAHTLMILQKAMAGERFFSRRVFDGTDEDGSNDVSVFIDTPQAHAIDMMPNATPALRQQTLLNQPVWPVRMAFFKLTSETGEPDYEMDMNLLANGIVQSMKIDYGDFSVTGTLNALEPLPAPHC